MKPARSNHEEAREGKEPKEKSQSERSGSQRN
jgi:hypothetical protein